MGFLLLLRRHQLKSPHEAAEYCALWDTNYGVTLNTIWRLESGYNKSARPSTIRKLAGALGVEPQELIKAS